jgi:hypothetical protein
MLGRSWQNIAAGNYPTRSNSAPSDVLSATGTNNAIRGQKRAALRVRRGELGPMTGSLPNR